VEWTVEKRRSFVRDGEPRAVGYGPPPQVLVDALKTNA